MWNTLAVVAGMLGACMAGASPTPPSPTPLESNSWALLVAGSNEYYNYRHQADISHAYHVMINEGIPADRIVVMMYDDIAYNKENPTPGVIINKPNGTNVYAGVKIDYREKDVTSGNFLKILSGDKKAMSGIGTGRVIESNENTNIFVYFADHGGAGMLCFPDDDTLMADDLERTIRLMHQNNKYNKFIFYVEACESGSVFENLIPEDIKVYVMTAAARDESSYGIYCDPICLGDEFSVTWMEHMDAEKTGTLETFFHQYQYVRGKVMKSHVQLYGDYSLGPNELTPNKKNDMFSPTGPGDVVSVSSRDAAIYYLRKKIGSSNNLADQQKSQRALDQILEGRKMADQLFDEFVISATPNSPKLRSIISTERLVLEKDIFPCYKKLLNHFRTSCFSLKNEYFLQHVYKFANMCLLNADVSNLLREMPRVCEPYKASIKVTIL